jgi:Tol biopolymer transport system component
MPLTSGTRLGPYEILAPLGAGGMGEVYRARDTRLGREVAVKVLPASLSSSPEVRARFEREARTVSSLNHPHVCVLHDVGREGAVDYLVMELVEGETLAARLARGALPVAELLKLGGQIADALDRAHRAGVVHRDLKPGNVMLAKSGAKLMDFGLARATGLTGPAVGSGATVAAMTQSPTIAQALTAEGTIVGTFQYLSPEQLEGREADARSDLWALGCVLYEMASGRRAFEGRSQASLIASIMHTQPPPVSQVAPLSPPALERLVAACLAKDPADRVQSAHDVKLQLEWMGEAPPSSSAVLPARPAAPGRPRWIAFALVALAAAAVTTLAMTRIPRGRATSAGAGTVQRFALGSVDLQGQSVPALSPDGSFVVVSVREGLTRRLHRRNLSSFDLTPIAGTEEGQAPFFSPDGAWLGFVTQDAVKKVPVGGGLAQTIVSEPRPDAGDWGRNGMVYFTSRAGGRDGLTALSRVPATGGKAEVVAALDTMAGESETWLPEILPDGKTVLITVNGGQGSAWRIVAVRADGKRHEVAQNALLGRYVPSGHLLYYDFESQAVLAARFDARKATISGPAVPLTEEVDVNFCFDVSTDGKLVYAPRPGAGQGDEVAWLDRKGAATLATDTRASWAQPRVSPDGRRLLLRKTGTSCELWMLDVPGGSPVRTVHGNDSHDAVWSPDGRRIAYRENNSPGAMVALTVEGAREVRTLARGADAGLPQSWSAGLLAYTLTGRGTRSDIWVRPMDGASPAVRFLATEFNEESPAVSPDGRWIAYVSNETGSPEVFVRSYPDAGNTWQLSTGGGSSPRWSPNGRELYFVVGAKMMASPVETRTGFRAGTPVMLFEGGFSASRGRDFDIAPDGRFAVVRHPGGAAGLPELRILLHWEQEMKRVAGASR